MNESKREALARRVLDLMGHVSDPGSAYYEEGLEVADFILTREAEREGPLVEAILDAVRGLNDAKHHLIAQDCLTALARYRALDAPPQRTLAEVAADVAALRERFVLEADRVRPLLDELADALRREKGAK